MARRCDDTIDKKRVNSCVLKHLFLEGVEQPKTIAQKNPGNALSDALLMSCFQKFAASAAKFLLGAKHVPAIEQDAPNSMHGALMWTNMAAKFAERIALADRDHLLQTLYTMLELQVRIAV